MSGDPVGDQPFDNAREFAAAAHREWERTMPPDRQAFLEHNAGSFANAAAAGAGELPRSEPPSTVVEVIGFLNAGVYLKDTKAAISAITQGDVLHDWISANRAEMKKVPTSTIGLVLKALVERAKELGVTVPADLGPELLIPKAAPVADAGPPQTNGTPQDDPSWRIARDRVDDMRHFQDEASLTGYVQKNQIMLVLLDRLRREGKDDVIAYLRTEAETIRAGLRSG